MASVKQETLSGVKWAAIEKFSVQGINFLLGLIMARLLTPEDFGIVGMLGIFLAVSDTFIDSGFGNALVQKQGRTDVDCSTVFYFNIVVSTLCYIILFLIAPWVADFFHTPILRSILRVQAINLVLNSFCAVHLARLTIVLDFKGIAKRSLYSSVISGFFGVLLASLGFGVWALVGQGLAYTVVNVVFIWIYCKWRPLVVFSWQSFRQLFSFGGYLLLSGLLNTIVKNLNSIVIGRFFSAEDLGYYSRGTSFARFPSNSINGVLGKVTFPVLAKIQDDDAHLIAVYRKYICITSMCIFFGCTLLAALGKPLILFLLTEKWSNAIIYLQIFSFSIMFDHISSINLNLLQVKGRSNYFFRLEVIKKIISVSILFASIPFGVLGICVSKVIYAQIATFINSYYTGKFYGLGYLEQYRDFGGFLLLSILVCVPAYLLTFLHWNHLLTLVVGASFSTGLYYFLLRKNPYMQEVLDICKSKIHQFIPSK